jgi:hypothetical protein
MHLIGQPEKLACSAIADGVAVWIKAASFTCDGVQINFYFLHGRVLRCEYDEDYEDRRIDEVDGSDLKDFMLCHHLM